ncbi:MAG: YitT family protein [Oscillospiraceae bacterium]|nr:YitT family protein [Oscillospiraceae bacterium]
MKGWRNVRDVSLIIFAALLLAFSYHIFIFPNEFAPAGLPGFATMLQYMLDFKVGYMMFIINVPLVIIVYLTVGHKYAIRSAVFAACFAGMLLVLDHVDLSLFIYDTGNSAILAPIAGGVVSGFCYGIVMRRNSSTGGTDLVAALVQHKWPEYNILWIIFTINAAVAAASYFVYGFKIEPVILCVIYCFISSEVSDIILKGFKEAVKFEIVTDQPEEMAKALMENLHHGVTELPAIGGYTHSDKTLLICVVNKRQIVRFQKVINKFPGSFAYLSSVKETMGNFKRSR